MGIHPSFQQQKKKKGNKGIKKKKKGADYNSLMALLKNPEKLQNYKAPDS